MWNDVSKVGLPKEPGDYLVTTKNGYVGIGKLWHTIYGESMWSGKYRNCVIAWQELPPAYYPQWQQD